MFRYLFLCLILAAAACQQQQPAATPFSVTLPPTQGAVLLITPPTTTPRPPTSTFTPTHTATNTAPPTKTLTNTRTPTPTDTLTPTITPTLERRELYSLARPIARAGTDWVDRNYPYGTTQDGRYAIHHGVEFQNPRGTPVLASAPGIVYFAGSDNETLFGEKLNYYGNLVVIEHDFKSPDGQPVFTLYGHLDRVEVETGERVDTGAKLGIVGDKGIAVGPHLHFEVRVGNAEDFGATRNPELWLYPYPTFGTLAGRVVDANGEFQYGVTIQVRQPENIRYAHTYEGDSVNSDLLWNENFTLGDLPEGQYEVIVSEETGKIHFRETITISSGKTTWVEIVLEQ